MPKAMLKCAGTHPKQHETAPKAWGKQRPKHHTETKTEPKTQTKSSSSDSENFFHTHTNPLLQLSYSRQQHRIRYAALFRFQRASAMVTRFFIPWNAPLTRWTTPFRVLFSQPCLSIPSLKASQSFSGILSSFCTALPQSLVPFTALILRTLITELQALFLQASSNVTFSTVPPKLLFRTQTSTASNLLLRRLSQRRNII
jgi:hypothetical protein